MPFFLSSAAVGVLEDVGGDVHVDTLVLRDEVEFDDMRRIESIAATQ